MSKNWSFFLQLTWNTLLRNFKICCSISVEEILDSVINSKRKPRTRKYSNKYVGKINRWSNVPVVRFKEPEKHRYEIIFQPQDLWTRFMRTWTRKPMNMSVNGHVGTWPRRLRDKRAHIVLTNMLFRNAVHWLKSPHLIGGGCFQITTLFSPTRPRWPPYMYVYVL